ncbi:LOW QUALITY PROTEIN: hypothetical protein PHPALM_31016 [Phytophthora palmivora]|uniref:Uncharacterized protein n=1 Tax=Phytophthora palmivora TaxID=4796 RepID=A0A2P4X3P3_9STRA|nr:LOW QUALITY PROTEIN: hypothetical protein PHPALM_31016 [Phytophthora palmivora]
METFPPTYWNVYGMRREIVSRTNNPLERFHRQLNARIQAPHPAMHRFVNTLEILALCDATQAVMSGLVKPPERQQFQLPRAPKLPKENDIVTSESDNETAEEVVVGIEISESCVSDSSSEGNESEGDCGPDLYFDFDGTV